MTARSHTRLIRKARQRRRAHALRKLGHEGREVERRRPARERKTP